MEPGKNDNNTNIPIESVQDAIPSLFNIPVVGHLYYNDDDEILMGGHDIEIEKTDEGKFKIKSITVPYGTVPQENNVCFEEVEEADGIKKTYLTCDIILWTGRYPELLDAKYNDEIYFAQSMEIIPLETEKINDYLLVKKFQFSALCLLGKSDEKDKNVIPCFKSARVEPYTFSEKENWEILFAEFKEQISNIYSAHDPEKGGKEKLNTEIVKKVLIEFGLNEDTKLDFEITENMTEDELRQKIQEKYSNAQKTEDFSTEASSDGESTSNIEGEESTKQEVTGDNQPGEDASSAEEITYSIDLTYEDKRKAINKALSGLNVCNNDMYAEYYLIDFDDNFVYSYYHTAGRNIKEESKTIRMPYVIVDDIVTINCDNAELVRQVWLTKEDEEKLSSEKELLNDLIKYKENRIEEDKKKSYANIIAEFADLSEIDEYKSIVKDAMTFESEEALTEKLYAIRGKYVNKQNKKQLGQIRIPIGFEAKSGKGKYDEFMERYLPSKK